MSVKEYNVYWIDGDSYERRKSIFYGSSQYDVQMEAESQGHKILWIARRPNFWMLYGSLILSYVLGYFSLVMLLNNINNSYSYVLLLIAFAVTATAGIFTIMKYIYL